MTFVHRPEGSLGPWVEAPPLSLIHEHPIRSWAEL